MEWLNYHHLLYFWTAARAGSITRACEQLRLAQPTVSAQIRALERALGEKLLAKSGRGVAPTETGRLVFRYADEIFSLGREMQDALRGLPTGRPARLLVGVADVIPKMVARRLLEVTGRLPEPVRLVCLEDKPEPLLARLAVHALDLVILDAPVGAGVKVRAYNHLLGECGVVFCAAPALARRAARGFPASLGEVPVLLPAENTAMRRSLDHWFESIGVRPRVAGEFEDSALMKAFGEDGAGVFPVPDVIARQVARQHRTRTVGPAAVRERFYAVTVERRITHPAVAAIAEQARRRIFG